MSSIRNIGMSLLALAVCCLAVPARAQFSPISQPNAGYLSSTTVLNITDPDFSVLSSLGNSLLTVSFTSDVVALTVPTTWSSWGVPPNTESATPRVLWTQGATSLTLDFSSPVGIFGLEAQPNTAVVSPITATFLNGATIVGTIDLDVDGNGGAKLFAARIDDPFTSVVLSSTDDFAIAQLRFGNVVPEPGAVALFIGAGISGAVFLRRWKSRKEFGMET